LGEDYDQLLFHMYNTVLKGVETPRPRVERAVDATNSALGEALGRAYVRRYFPPEMKANVTEMVELIRAELIDRIECLSWMTPETKARAQEKVNKMTLQIGYPEDGGWIDYSSLDLKPDDVLAAHQMRINMFDVQRDLDRVGQPVNRDEWYWPPQTVNACNIPNMNQINFPAGILQHPVLTSEEAINWGAFGMIIAHEIIHSFDDEGRKFDAEGNVRDWWMPEDGQRFEAHADILRRQFDSYSVQFSDGEEAFVNGAMCLGENIADLGGLIVSHSAFMRSLEGKEQETIDGFTPEQRFFLGYAQVWHYIATDDAARLRIATDPHSPPLWRVNGALSQIPAFRKAFGVAKDCPMWIKDELQSQMWLKDDEL
ncbi:MAG: M13 family metallopeptidase, partial [Chlamydiia bacterium]|nr:M13 family metallopeptidase [Chlamydiia bacterium]